MAWVEAVTARLALGPVRTPAASLMVVGLPERTLRFDRVRVD